MKFLDNLFDSIHEYVIEHKKYDNGDDGYAIKHVWFGLIEWPFHETEVISGICNRTWWKTYRRWYSYNTLEQAKRALQRYIDEPYVEYRGHKITRCHNSMWIDYSTGERPRAGYNRYHDWYEYKAGGNLESCKKKIDDLIEIEYNRKFKEKIKL